MNIKRVLHIIFYLVAAFLCLGAFFLSLFRAYLLSKSSFGIPYLSLFILIFLVPAILFTYQAIKHDKRSSFVIIGLTITAILYLAFDVYQMRAEAIYMEAIRGPYQGLNWDRLWFEFGPFLLLLLGAILLHPRKKRAKINLDSHY